MKNRYWDAANVRMNVVAAVAATGVLLGAGAASAGEMQPAPAPGWVITVGAMGAFGPEYAGASDNSWRILPTLSWRREGAPVEFSAPDEGFSYALIDTSRFKLGPVGTLGDGRDAKDDPRLVGLNEYDTTIQAGVFMDYWLVQDFLRTRIELRHGFGSEDGFMMDLSADVVKRFGRLTLSAGPRMTFSDSDEMMKKYGVTGAEGAINPYVSAYNPDGGLESVGINVALRYELTRDVTLTIYDRFDHLVGDAADSPITRQLGSANQNTVGVGLSYSFHTGN